MNVRGAGGPKAKDGPTSDADPIDAAELDAADAIGRLMQFWGFKRPMGRMWTLLYLSPDALGAAELAARLLMSAGAVSMTLGELLKWGAVKKTWRPGERRDFFEAETDIWKLVRRVLRERELSLVREVGDAMEKAKAALDAKPVDVEARRRIAFKRERIDRVRQLARIGEALIDAFVSGQSVDTAPIVAIAGNK